MLPHRDDILQQALALPAEDRAFVIAALEQSLGPNSAELPPDAVEAGGANALNETDFLKELERRSAAYRDGSTSARPVTEVLAELRRRQSGEGAI